MTIIAPPAIVWQNAVQAALTEDLGRRGDITSRALFLSTQKAEAAFVARVPGVICGLDVAAQVFRTLDPSVTFTALTRDGVVVAAGQVFARVSGAVVTLLEGERTALNFLTHLSGIATTTAEYVAQVNGTKTKICCTRKTTPGLRALEKYAVACGGGANHRFGLDDAALIKDNHIAAAGGDVVKAVRTLRAALGHMVKIEVEVDRADQLEKILNEKIDAVLLDNWPVDDLPRAVAQISGRFITEVSGGVTLARIPAIARAGVDLISVGRLTHSSTALDIGLDMDVA